MQSTDGQECEQFVKCSECGECGQANGWGCAGGRARVVLGGVLRGLRGRELARAARVCRGWRAAAQEPALWRRALVNEYAAAPHAIRALALSAHADLNIDAEDGGGDPGPEWSWRDEYVRVAAGWRCVGALWPNSSGKQGKVDEQLGSHDRYLTENRGGSAVLLHGALNARKDAFATAADDASVTVWSRSEGAGAWRQVWHTVGLRRRGWRSCARVEWEPAEPERLLVAGPLALTDRWELLVLKFSKDETGAWQGQIRARANGAAGAAGCWAGVGAFLSLELRLLAPSRAVTTVWLNSATQESESEFSGVAAPILRVYNEAQAHLSHVMVVKVTDYAETDAVARISDASYLRAALALSSDEITDTEPEDVEPTPRLLLAACGRVDGKKGIATALAGWWLRAARPPPLFAAVAGDLAERVARRASRPRPDVVPEAPSEDELRVLCEPPVAVLPLHDRLIGITPHPGGRCVWAMDAAGCATCASLPALQALRKLQPKASLQAPLVTHSAHYVQPAASCWLVASPVGGYSPRVAVWSARSGAQCEEPETKAEGSPATCVLLPSPRELLLLAGDAVQVWESRATPHEYD